LELIEIGTLVEVLRGEACRPEFAAIQKVIYSPYKFLFFWGSNPF